MDFDVRLRILLWFGSDRLISIGLHSAYLVSVYVLQRIQLQLSSLKHDCLCEFFWSTVSSGWFKMYQSTQNNNKCVHLFQFNFMHYVEVLSFCWSIFFFQFSFCLFFFIQHQSIQFLYCILLNNCLDLCSKPLLKMVSSGLLMGAFRMNLNPYPNPGETTNTMCEIWISFAIFYCIICCCPWMMCSDLKIDIPKVKKKNIYIINHN